MLYSQGAPAAMGSIERYSFEFWEAASIRVYPGFRRKGFGRAMTAFLTDKIVSSGKTATCRTLPENAGMNRIIAECGYQRLYTDI
jgi:predicted GNAT family acetyltransferase